MSYFPEDFCENQQLKSVEKLTKSKMIIILKIIILAQNNNVKTNYVKEEVRLRRIVRVGYM